MVEDESSPNQGNPDGSGQSEAQSGAILGVFGLHLRKSK